MGGKKNSRLNSRSGFPLSKQPQVAVVHSKQTVAYSGPLPPATEFAHYEDVYPGAAKIILNMAVDEQTHRHALEQATTQSMISDSVLERREIKRSQWMAFVVVVLMVGTGGFLVYSGHPKAGSLITGATLVGVISAFLVRPKKQPRLANGEVTPAPGKKHKPTPNLDKTPQKTASLP